MYLEIYREPMYKANTYITYVTSTVITTSTENSIHQLASFFNFHQFGSTLSTEHLATLLENNMPHSCVPENKTEESSMRLLYITSTQKMHIVAERSYPQASNASVH